MSCVSSSLLPACFQTSITNYRRSTVRPQCRQGGQSPNFDGNLSTSNSFLNFIICFCFLAKSKPNLHHVSVLFLHTTNIRDEIFHEPRYWLAKLKSRHLSPRICITGADGLRFCAGVPLVPAALASRAACLGRLGELCGGWQAACLQSPC